MGSLAATLLKPLLNSKSSSGLTKKWPYVWALFRHSPVGHRTDSFIGGAGGGSLHYFLHLPPSRSFGWSIRDYGHSWCVKACSALMPFDRRKHLLPLWDSSSSTVDTEKPEETQMILISVPPALESALRAVVRWGTGGVSQELRDTEILSSRRASPTSFGT